MKKVLYLLLVVSLLGILAGCDGPNGDPDTGGAGIKLASDPNVQRIYDELKDARTALTARSVIGLGSITATYRSARIDKIIDGYTGYPDHEYLGDEFFEDWGVGEGDITMTNHIINGDEWEIWIFISIQNGERYSIYANDDNADRLEFGVTDDESQLGQVWFCRW